MKRRVLVSAFALTGTTVFAQSDDWVSRVENIVQGFDQAVATETIVPFALDYDHPDLAIEFAGLFGMSAEEFNLLVRKGYADSTAASDIVA